ncbi:MAG: hypothetical protein IPH13_09865 [Planctomycetes bacterium]|nr:hypothetical protein [Planctomycetota bacterium]
MPSRPRTRLLALAFGVIVASVAAEVVLRILDLPRGRAHGVVARTIAEGVFEVHCGESGAEAVNTVVARAKPAGTLRVVFVGDSTIHGFVLAEQSTIPRLFAAQFEHLSGRRVDPVVLAAPGLDAAQVAELARFAARELELDAIVVYTGNNEFLPAATEAVAARRAVRLPESLANLLETTRLGALLVRALQPVPRGGLVAPGTTAPSTWIEPTSRTAALRPFILERFAATLDRLATELTAQGVALVFALPVSNGREYPPIQSAFSRPLDPSTQESYRARLESAARAISSGELERAGAEIEALRAIDPDVAILRHVEADWTRARGEVDVARGLDLEAWGLDENARAASTAILARIVAAAERHGLPLLDARAAIERAPVVGEGALFVDHCHPTVRGQAIVAAEWALALVPRLAPQGAATTQAALRERLLGPAEVCAKAGVAPDALHDSEGMKFVGDLFYALTAPDPEPFLVRVRAQLAAQDPLHPTLEHFVLADLVLALLDGDRDRAVLRSARLAVEQPETAVRLRAMVFGADRLRSRVEALGLQVEPDGRFRVAER